MQQPLARMARTFNEFLDVFDFNDSNRVLRARANAQKRKVDENKSYICLKWNKTKEKLTPYKKIAFCLKF
jgi:hypothetical protein